MSLSLLCLCQFVGIAAFEMGTPYVPARLSELGVSGTAALVRWSGWAQAVTLILSIVCTPLWARLGDARGRKAVLVRAHAGLALSLLWLSFARTPLELLCARALQGLLAGITAAALALVSEDERASSRMAWLQSCSLTGALAGPFLGAWLLRGMEVAEVFRAGAALCGVSTLLAVFLSEPNRSASAQIEARPSARAFAGAGSLAAWVFAWRALEDPVLAVYVRELTPSGGDWALWTATVLGASRLTAILAGPWWGRWSDRFGPEGPLRLAVWGAALLTVAQVATTGPASLALVRAALGVFTGALAPSVYALTALRFPPETRGQAVAFATSGARLGDCLGNAAAAPIVAAVGIPGLFAAMGAGLLGSIPLLRKRETGCAS